MLTKRGHPDSYCYFIFFAFICMTMLAGQQEGYAAYKSSSSAIPGGYEILDACSGLELLQKIRQE